MMLAELVTSPFQVEIEEASLQSLTTLLRQISIFAYTSTSKSPLPFQTKFEKIFEASTRSTQLTILFYAHFIQDCKSNLNL